MVVIEHHICWPQFWSSLLEILAVSQSHGGPLISGSFSAEMDDGPAGVQSSVHYSWTSCDFSSGIPKLDTRIPSPRGKAWPLFFKKSVELLILSVPRSAAPLLQLQLLAPGSPLGQWRPRAPFQMFQRQNKAAWLSLWWLIDSVPGTTMATLMRREQHEIICRL